MGGGGGGGSRAKHILYLVFASQFPPWRVSYAATRVSYKSRLTRIPLVPIRAQIQGMTADLENALYVSQI